MTTAYPLAWPTGWPRTVDHRRVSDGVFNTSFERARSRLLNELRLLKAKSVVISSWIALRQDGQPYADQARRRIADPGVAIYFQLRNHPMVIARDAYVSCHGNLRSIGLAIEALRALERHGGGHMMERAFAGFTALPPPKGASTPAEKPWREMFAPIPPGIDPGDLLIIVENRYRKAAQTAHADVGGSGETMILLNAAIARAREELKP